MSDLPGLDLDRLAEFLREAAPGLLDGPLSGSVIAGGRSNLTYRVGDGRTQVVVRRPPLGHVLATAHDMGREYQVISALSGSAVPVPRTYALCEDEDVIGAPFYVMSLARGTAYRRASELADLGAERVTALSAALVDTLAALHAVDPESVGLGEFGHPDGFVARQVRRWHRQYEASRTRELAGYDDLHAYLSEHTPPESGATIVHGDFRLDNVLVDSTVPGDPITAVLDWEMATLGDPLTDLALMLVYQRMATHAASGLVADAPLAPGYLSPDAVAERYRVRSGRDVSELRYYLALAYFKLAIILEGIHVRYVHGQTVGAGFEHIGDLTEPLVAAGLAEAHAN